MTFFDRKFTPPERLEERLSYGGSEPDAELRARAAACAGWFKDNPEERLIWLPRLRKAKASSLTADLWNEIEPIIDSTLRF